MGTTNTGTPGRTIASNGYVLVRVGKSHHLADVRGYAYEHRLVAEEKIGRRLEPGEMVHHKNEIIDDNRPENLEVLTAAEHRLEHRANDSRLALPGSINPKVLCECGCGESFDLYDEFLRPRRFIPGHNSQAQPAPTRDSIVAAVNGGATTIVALMAATGKTEQAVKVALTKMVRAGQLRRVGRGRYAPSEASP